MQPRLPQGQRRAAALDDHVADLAGGAATVPLLAAEDQPAADAGPPEDAEDGVVMAAGAELVLGVGGDADVVADRDPRPEGVGQARAEREAAAPVGQVLGVGDDAPVAARPRPGEPTPTPLQRRRSRPRRPPPPRGSAPAIAVGDARRPVVVGRRMRAPRRAPRCSAVDDDRLDLRPAEVDPAAVGPRLIGVIIRAPRRRRRAAAPAPARRRCRSAASAGRSARRARARSRAGRGPRARRRRCRAGRDGRRGRRSRGSRCRSAGSRCSST